LWFNCTQNINKTVLFNMTQHMTVFNNRVSILSHLDVGSVLAFLYIDSIVKTKIYTSNYTAELKLKTRSYTNICTIFWKYNVRSNNIHKKQQKRDPWRLTTIFLYHLLLPAPGFCSLVMHDSITMRSIFVVSAVRIPTANTESLQIWNTSSSSINFQ